MSDTVIQIEGLWKEYRLGVIGHGTLTRDLQSWWARVRGKEDPNSKIQPMLAGQEKQIEGDCFWALRDINLEVKEGEILGIIGKNGAGKSTLLKLLSRVTAPTKGQIKIKGRIASLLEVGTGFHPELTGRENIFMNGAILGMSKQEIKSKLDEIIDFSGVEKFIDTPVKRYSSGMYVRLAFAVAAHLDPEILVIDEVLAVGDAEFQKKCLGKMGEVSKAGRTVLFVSHNLLAISSLCNRVFLLKDGSPQDDGAPRKIIPSYYTSFGMKEKHRIDFTNDKVGDEFVQLLKGEIVRIDGGDISEITLNEDIEIVMSFKVKRHNSHLMIPLIHITFGDSQHVFSNMMPNVNHFNIGIYEARCRIPRRLLNEGSYRVGLEMTSSGSNVWIVNFSEREVLYFRVWDNMDESSGRYSYAGTFPGVVRPRLEWTLQQIN